MATKESKLKNPVVNKGSSSSKDANEKDTGSVWPFPWIKLSIPKKKDKKITNAVASDDSDIDEKEENEKEARIHQGISLDKLSVPVPKKKLLVLPLNGIIVHRAYRIKPDAIPKTRQPDFLYGNYKVYKRPYCEEFLKFCLERFEVGIWSSAREQNIQWVLTNVVGELKSKILFTWDQNQCMDTGFKCLDNRDKPLFIKEDTRDKPLFIKELRHIWDNKYSNLPWRDGEYSSSNTLLICAPVKALLNPPNTGIFPRNYDPDNKEDNFLGPDGELRVFLNGLAEAMDVPTYVKDHRIGEPPITNSHPDWAYYSEVIRSINDRYQHTQSTPKLTPQQQQQQQQYPIPPERGMGKVRCIQSHPYPKVSASEHTKMRVCKRTYNGLLPERPPASERVQANIQRTASRYQNIQSTPESTPNHQKPKIQWQPKIKS